MEESPTLSTSSAHSSPILRKNFSGFFGLRKRDLFLLVLSIVGLLFSWIEQNGLKLELVFHIPLSTDHYSNGHYPQLSKSELLPKPLITDLDGDRLNEIIYVTPDYFLKVAQFNQEVEENGERRNIGFWDPVLLKSRKEASLLPIIKISVGRKPIALASGYLTPYVPGVAREQVIVVVTDGWTILCYDSKLKLLWQSNVQGYILPKFYHNEISIIVLPQALRVGDKGSVIVGGRLALDSSSILEHEHHDNEENKNTQTNLHSDDEYYRKQTQHFSFYAFDGKTGALRWKLEEGDFENQDREENLNSISHQSFKLHVLRNMHHMGEMDWHQFRDSIFNQLPHQWTHRDDTYLTISHFEKKNKEGGRHKSNQWSFDDLGLIIDIPGFSKAESHSQLDHISEPNVVVAKHKDGIEVIHLFTGRPVCRLQLQDGLYIDLNDDGIIDRIQAFVGTGHFKGKSISAAVFKKHFVCYAYATTGVPTLEPLFNVSLCDFAFGFFWDILKETEIPNRFFRALPPIALRKKPSSIFQTSSFMFQYDSIFLLSNGMMIAISPTGKVNWKVRVGSWDEFKIIQSHPKNKKGPKDSVKIPTEASLLSYPLMEEDLILAITSTISLVSPEGEILNEFELEEIIPLQSPTLGDFNNDGILDILLLGYKGYYGITVSRTNASTFFPLFLAILVFSIIAFLIKTEYSQRKKLQQASKEKNK